MVLIIIPVGLITVLIVVIITRTVTPIWENTDYGPNDCYCPKDAHCLDPPDLNVTILGEPKIGDKYAHRAAMGYSGPAPAVAHMDYSWETSH